MTNKHLYIAMDTFSRDVCVFTNVRLLTDTLKLKYRSVLNKLNEKQTWTNDRYVIFKRNVNEPFTTRSNKHLD